MLSQSFWAWHKVVSTYVALMSHKLKGLRCTHIATVKSHLPGMVFQLVIKQVCNIQQPHFCACMPILPHVVTLQPFHQLPFHSLILSWLTSLPFCYSHLYRLPMFTLIKFIILFSHITAYRKEVSKAIHSPGDRPALPSRALLLLLQLPRLRPLHLVVFCCQTCPSFRPPHLRSTTWTAQIYTWSGRFASSSPAPIFKI